jgi:hypothetical protein
MTPTSQRDWLFRRELVSRKPVPIQGLDSISFEGDAVSEPPTGEHWTFLSVQL